MPEVWRSIQERVFCDLKLEVWILSPSYCCSDTIFYLPGMSTPSDEDSQDNHEGEPLRAADYPDLHRFTFGQMRILQSHLVEYPALSREDRPEFLQKCFEEVWVLESPSWDWDGRPPKKEDNPKLLNAWLEQHSK